MATIRKRTQRERKEFILRKIKERGRVTVPELAKGMRVTTETVYRDLKPLMYDGEVVKRHNYITIDKNYEPKKKDYSKIRFEEQETIIRHCAEVIDDGDNLILDGHNMIIRLLAYISCKKNLTIFTTNFDVMTEVAKYKNMTLVSLGGILDKVNSEFYIDEEPTFLKNIVFNKYLLTCDGAEDGVITINNTNKIQTTKILLTKADKVILLAPFNKFGKKALADVCSYNEIDNVISNDILPREFETDLRKYNVIVDLV
jgi:DeoR/GlpR family transcriptional regulator of sugar metabolism